MCSIVVVPYIISVYTLKVSLPSWVEDIEHRLAAHIHDVWAVSKIDSGWTYNEVSVLVHVLSTGLSTFDSLQNVNAIYMVDSSYLNTFVP